MFRRFERQPPTLDSAMSVVTGNPEYRRERGPFLSLARNCANFASPDNRRYLFSSAAALLLPATKRGIASCDPAPQLIQVVPGTAIENIRLSHRRSLFCIA